MRCSVRRTKCAVRRTLTLGINMQPSNKQGRMLRMAMMPISWLIALATVVLYIHVVAYILDQGPRQILATKSFWPLVLILPSAYFGKVLGLIFFNLAAYCIPPIRNIFNRECAETGRYNFATATKGLLKILALSGIITIICGMAFINNQQNAQQGGPGYPPQGVGSPDP